MDNFVNQFSDLWESFITSVRGGLRKAAEENALTYGRAKAVLAERALSWQGDYEAEGRWVNSIVKADPAKGKKVRQILTRDIAFQAEDEPSSSVLPQAIGAIGGGAAGYGIASALNFGTVGTIASTAIPIVAGAIAGNIYAGKQKYAAIDRTIDAYVGQLDSYYHSVIAVINA